MPLSLFPDTYEVHCSRECVARRRKAGTKGSCESICLYIQALEKSGQGCESGGEVSEWAAGTVAERRWKRTGPLSPRSLSRPRQLTCRAVPSGVER
ncbi:hypothetical protein AAFF_G00053660 [Aldrovandia affinis]|uniref:Uncharacterized protein n=1 Tax=Aldrovandia affinis TaxID=143900 RepID=A0AAD7S129_9TELE|nr:hypothetical protein AAFF_G00053660 [Aldrovandia affinis]